MTDEYSSSTPTTPRLKHLTRSFHGYEKERRPSNGSSLEEEERESYESRRMDSANRRNTNSTYGLSYIRRSRFEAKEGESYGARRLKNGKWETDDESCSKTLQRRSLPAHQQPNSQHHTQHTNPQRHSQGAYMEEANTKSLIYLLDKERAKRADIQKAYESTSQTLCDLQKTHQDDVTTLESDIQLLQNALVKEAKVSLQLKQLLRDAHAKFTEEMQVWANKVAEMDEQGRELQKTFAETINRLEQEEDEIIRLRQENKSLKDQLAGRPIESNNYIRPSLEDVYKVGSLEEGDDASTTTETKTAVDMGENSDGESMASYSKIAELTDCISKLESELSSTKEKLHKSESIINDLQADKQATVKQIEEKHEKQVKLLRASLAQKQKMIEDLQQELRMTRFSQNREREREEKLLTERNKLLQSKQERMLIPSLKDDRRHARSVQPQHKRRVSISENFLSHDRKGSVTSTNSGSLENGSSNGDKDDIQSSILEFNEDQSELFSDEEEERDDQSSSLYTGSAASNRGSEKTASTAAPTIDEDFPRITLSSRQYQHRNNMNEHDGGNCNEENEDDILDVILSDREDRSLPLIGHYSAAEYTEDEDFSFERVVSKSASVSRRQSMVGGGRMNGRFNPQSLTRSLGRIAARGWMSGDDVIP